MKKLLKGGLLALVLALTITTVALACHGAYQNWVNCEGYELEAKMVGKAYYSYDIDVTIDGVTTNYNSPIQWQKGTIYSLQDTGEHDIEVKGKIEKFKKKRFLWYTWFERTGYYGVDFSFSTDQCYKTCDETFPEYGGWSDWAFDPQTGMMKRTRTVILYDARDGETVCDKDTEEQFDQYNACEGETEVIISEWSDWYGHPPNLTRERTITEIDVNTREVCSELVEYQQECFADEYIWVWKLFMPDGSICELRDFGYDGTYTSPGVDQQRAYCGCEVAENAHGYYVSNCDNGFKYWYDLPRYNGCGKCE